MWCRVFAFLVMSSQAMACDYCNPKITFDKTLSQCYLERFETEIQQMETAGLPAQLVNLASCDQVRSITRGGGSLPSATATVEEEPSVTFVMDAEGMRCLAKSLREQVWADQSLLTFEIQRGC